MDTAQQNEQAALPRPSWLRPVGLPVEMGDTATGVPLGARIPTTPRAKSRSPPRKVPWAANALSVATAKAIPVAASVQPMPKVKLKSPFSGLTAAQIAARDAATKPPSPGAGTTTANSVQQQQQQQLPLASSHELETQAVVPSSATQTPPPSATRPSNTVPILAAPPLSQKLAPLAVLDAMPALQFDTKLLADTANVNSLGGVRVTGHAGVGDFEPPDAAPAAIVVEGFRAARLNTTYTVDACSRVAGRVTFWDKSKKVFWYYQADEQRWVICPHYDTDGADLLCDVQKGGKRGLAIEVADRTWLEFYEGDWTIRSPRLTFLFAKPSELAAAELSEGKWDSDVAQQLDRDGSLDELILIKEEGVAKLVMRFRSLADSSDALRLGRKLLGGSQAESADCMDEGAFRDVCRQHEHTGWKWRRKSA